MTNPFTYTAREAGEAGLMYYRARYYQPNVGRFVSEDPLSLNQNFAHFSQYGYVFNNPIISTDPTGLFKVTEDCCKFGPNGGPPGPSHGPPDDTLTDRIIKVVTCQVVGSTITDPALKKCVKESCEKGSIACTGKCERGGGAQNDIGSLDQPDIDLELCPQKWIHPPTDTYLIDISTHEWAHGCGWDHCQGKGVPFQRCGER